MSRALKNTGEKACGNKISAPRGNAGENAVCDYLKKQGSAIIKRNYRTKGGEIDIISEKDGCIAFTEVKTRKLDPMIKGSEAITKAKMRRIINTSEYFIISNPQYKDRKRRFDAAFVTVTTDKLPQILDIEYYKGYFTLEDLE